MPAQEFEGVLHSLNNEINLLKKKLEKPASARGPPGEWRGDPRTPVVEVEQQIIRWYEIKTSSAAGAAFLPKIASVLSQNS